MRILFHGPGLAAFRPETGMPHLLGVQATSADSLGALHPNHLLTGNRGNIIHAEAPAKIFQKKPRLSAYGNIAALQRSLGERFSEQIAANFDIVIVSLANFIRPDNDGSALFRALNALDDAIPFVILGAGLQGQHALSDMMPGNRDLIAIINERAKLFGVRGAQTAEWLASNGFNNTNVLGCPSLYAYPQSILSVDGKAARARGREADVMTAGHLSIRNGAIVERGENLVSAFKGINASYVFQDEFFHYEELAKQEFVYNEGNGQCLAGPINDWLSKRCHTPVNFRRYYYFNEAGAWRQSALRHDVYIGDRFHGGVAALQAGCPAIFLKHDNRVSELTEHFALPALSTQKFAELGLAATLEQYLDEAVLAQMKATYRNRHAEFQTAMKQVGLTVATRLPAA